MDGIRGVAILLVVIYHYGWESCARATGLLPHAIGSALILGWSGVDLFFVLSGFLIGGILFDHRDSGNYFRTFYVRRVCRILPAYYLIVGLVFVIPIFLPARAPTWFLTLFQEQTPKIPKWGFFLFLQNFYAAKTGFISPAFIAITWSLVVEEQFYLLLPFSIRFLFPRKPIGVLIFLIVLVPIFRTFLFLFHPDIFIYPLLPCRADALLLGVLCTCLVRDPRWRHRFENNRKTLYFVFVILFFGAICLAVFANRIVRGNEVFVLNSFEMITFGFSWLALFYACFLLIVVTAKDGLMAGMRVPALRHFGLIAYGTYLIHMPVANTVHGLFQGTGSVTIRTFSDFAATVLAFLATWLLAVLSWNFLEKPIIRWGHSFTYKSRDEATPEPVASNPVASP